MKKYNIHKIFNSKYKLFIIAALFFFLGYLVFTYIHLQKKTTKDFDFFWNVWSLVEEKYPFEEPSFEDKMYGAIRGFVHSYEDDYSSFLTPQKSKFFDQTISGKFGGIGAEISIKNGYLVVVAPLKNSPAEKSGLKSGDIITHVDTLDISNKTFEQVLSEIRGTIGDEVVLTIVRLGKEEPFDISIVRDIVHIPILETEIIDDIFIIHFHNFNESSEKEFKEALIEMNNKGYDKLLIDVRNNPGGFLHLAIEIASYIMPQGKIITREQKGLEEGDEIIYRSKGYNIIDPEKIKIMTLINHGSASASEILVGALSENNYAQVVGERSFGKGSVQEHIQLSNKTSLKITVARWLTPNKNHISGVGIKPDIEIKFTTNSKQEDTQLLQAIKLFNN